jgi:23S rRNA maturation-related 3'-5' exoribonuclease YhaM
MKLTTNKGRTMDSEQDVNTQIVDTVNKVQEATLSGNVVKVSGTGKAFQSISQSSAIAVQDATDNLRNINTMATTAMGVALSQMLATGQTEPYAGILKEVNTLVIQSTTNFTSVGTGASQVLEEFSKGL